MTWIIYFKGKTEPVHVEADYIDDDSSDGWVKLITRNSHNAPKTVAIVNSSEVLTIVRCWP